MLSRPSAVKVGMHLARRRSLVRWPLAATSFPCMVGSDHDMAQTTKRSHPMVGHLNQGQRFHSSAFLEHKEEIEEAPPPTSVDEYSKKVQQLQTHADNLDKELYDAFQVLQDLSQSHPESLSQDNQVIALSQHVLAHCARRRTVKLVRRMDWILTQNIATNISPHLKMALLECWSHLPSSVSDTDQLDLIVNRSMKLIEDLKLMEDGDDRPDPISIEAINRILNAMAKLGRFQQAFSLLEAMQGGDINILPDPDLVTFNTTIKACTVYTKSKNPNQKDNRPGLVAWSILQYMKQDGFILQGKTFATVLAILAACPLRQVDDFPQRILGVLDDMKKLKGGPKKRWPDRESYATAILALARSGHPKTAQDVLRQARLFTFTFKVSLVNEILLAWARTPSEGDRECKRLFNDMHRLSTAPPNVDSYAHLMLAYAMNGKLDKVQQTFDALVEDWDTNNRCQRLQPSLKCFEAVLVGLQRASTQQPQAPEQAQSILNMMKELHKDYGLRTMPNTKIYNLILECWARAKRPDSGEHAENLLRMMAEDGVLPNLISYNIVLHAYAHAATYESSVSTDRCVPTHQPSSEAMDRAISLIQELHHLAKEHPQYRPSASTYRTILKLVQASQLQDKDVRVANIIKYMKANGMLRSGEDSMVKS